MADALEHREEIGDGIEAQMALAKFAASDDFGGEFVGLIGGVEPEVNALADAKLASGMDEGFPQIWLGGKLTREQHFDSSVQKFRGRRDWKGRRAGHANRCDVRRVAPAGRACC